jgi:hypothetical protein
VLFTVVLAGLLALLGVAPAVGSALTAPTAGPPCGSAASDPTGGAGTSLGDHPIAPDGVLRAADRVQQHRAGVPVPLAASSVLALAPAAVPHAARPRPPTTQAPCDAAPISRRGPPLPGR